MLMTELPESLTATLAVALLGLLTLVAIASTIAAIARDGHRRTPQRHLERWYQRDEVMRSCATAPR